MKKVIATVAILASFSASAASDKWGNNMVGTAMIDAIEGDAIYALATYDGETDVQFVFKNIP
ncbi:hypothetical protein BIZ37_27590 [Photobacterium sp. BZF1]|uniref:hypothetical protein n=1 Tax=Photobacterium sp. BZF1 TaxID=1904457 RepID=UPI00165374FD|nr:hypothetical protein [Photobacterium sp. BZF1]MBC7006326.1 hypothetical protein [Photobacterium sp. BZF1]